jgi:hypothetical protein
MVGWIGANMKLNIFSCNDNLTTYTYPLVKILVCVVLIILPIYRGHFINLDNIIFNAIMGGVSFVVGIAGVLCVYISIAEIILINEKKTKASIVLKDAIKLSKEYSIDEIIFLVEKNDIIEIQVLSNNRIVEVGSSSDSKQGSSKFFDKRYYIDKKEICDLEDFKASLLLHSINEKVIVFSIDGIHPKRKK